MNALTPDFKTIALTDLAPSSQATVIPSWYQVPEEIKQLLLAAVLAWEDTARSEQFILQALDHPDATLEVLVSAYRYFFYKNNDPMARRLALQVMEQIKVEEGLPDEWEKLEEIFQQRFYDPPIRLYLSAYTALGVMLARWGAYEAAIEISNHVKSVDERNEFGAGVILNILSPED
ncbi:MAG: hypothetical protein RLZZ435_2682 [Cyanobacteriota bacterium]